MSLHILQAFNYTDHASQWSFALAQSSQQWQLSVLLCQLLPLIFLYILLVSILLPNFSLVMLYTLTKNHRYYLSYRIARMSQHITFLISSITFLVGGPPIVDVRWGVNMLAENLCIVPPPPSPPTPFSNLDFLVFSKVSTEFRQNGVFYNFLPTYFQTYVGIGNKFRGIPKREAWWTSSVFPVRNFKFPYFSSVLRVS